MSYMINFSGMAPDMLDQLNQRVTDAINAAPVTDTKDIQLVGQVLDYHLRKTPETSLVDVSVNGGTEPATQNTHCTISFRTRNTAPQVQKTVPWTPSVGPLNPTG